MKSIRVKKLHLNKQTLRQLTSADLDRVGGGTNTFGPVQCVPGTRVAGVRCDTTGIGQTVVPIPPLPTTGVQSLGLFCK